MVGKQCFYGCGFIRFIKRIDGIAIEFCYGIHKSSDHQEIAITQHTKEILLKKGHIRRYSLPLKGPLGMVNVYTVIGEDQFWLIDAGLRVPEHKAKIQTLIEEQRNKGYSLKGLIISHHHPDHVGWGDWITEQYDCPIYMAPAEYKALQTLSNANHNDFYETARTHYKRHGFAAAQIELMMKYLIRSQPLFPTLSDQPHPLINKEKLKIAENIFDIIYIRGHAPAHPCFYHKESNTLIAIDAILQKITPNISVWPDRPDEDPLSRFKADLKDIAEIIDDDTLILPGHGEPFRGGRTRVHDILKHHIRREKKLIEILHDKGPLPVADFVRQIYKRPFAQSDWVFGTGEALAHANHLYSRGSIQKIKDPGIKDPENDRILFSYPGP